MRHPDLFAVRLRAARLAAGLTPLDLSAELRVTRTAIYHMESGRRQPSLRTARRCAVALGVSLDWLAGLSGDGPCVTSTT